MWRASGPLGLKKFRGQKLPSEYHGPMNVASKITLNMLEKTSGCGVDRGTSKTGRAAEYVFQEKVKKRGNLGGE